MSTYKPINARQVLASVTTDSTTTGSAATIQNTYVPNGVVRLTNSSLTSISGIPTATAGQYVTIENQTGNSISINNNDAGASVGNRIYTGTGANVTILANSTLEFVYDGAVDFWMLVGGVGSGSGAGSKNYLSAYLASTSSNVPNPGNGNFELGSTSGWSLAHTTFTTANGYFFPTGAGTPGSGFSSINGGTSASGNLSLSLVSSGQLAGSYSGDLASSAMSVQGDLLISNAFFIDTEDQGKVITIKFYYEAESGASNLDFSGTSSNSFAVWIYDVTNAAWIMPAGVYDLVQNSGVGYCTGTFQTTINSTQYQLALVNINASSGAYNLYIDDFFVGPQTAPFGPILGDWTDITSNIVLSSGFGTASNKSFWRKRVGDSYHYRGSFTIGTVASTTMYIQLPSTETIDSSKFSSASDVQKVGFAQNMDPTGSITDLYAHEASAPLDIFYDGSTTNQVFLTQYTQSSAYIKANASGTVASSGTITFDFMIPITGFSSNSVMSNDTDTRVCAATYYLSANTSETGGQPINFDAQLLDTHGTVTTGSSWKFTAPISGNYKVTASGLSPSITPNMSIYKNGSDYFDSGSTGGADETCNISAILYLNAGDYVDIRPGSTETFRGGAPGSGNNFTFVSIERLSGPAVIAATESVNMSYFCTNANAIGTSYTPIVYNLEKFDSHDAYNDSSGTYTIPVTGKYRVSASITSSGTTLTTTQRMNIAIFQNGSSYSDLFIFGNGGATISYSFQISNTVSCLAGDTLQIQAFSNVAATTSGNPGESVLCIERIGN